MSLTILLHVAQIVLYPPLDAASQRSVRQSQPPATAIEPAILRPLATTAAAVRGGGGGERLMIVTATQPGPCTTRRGDHVLSLALKNKWQFATMHGHGMWLSSELLSPWDLAGQWNKVAVLAALMQPASEARGGASWLLWADDDVLFSDMSFRFPLGQYEAQEAWLVLWGDERMTYELGDSEGVNTGTMLLRVCDWSRTSTLHYVLRSGWHPRVALNKGEKEVHHFSLDDNHAMGPARYQAREGAATQQARWDGEGAQLGTCPGREDEVLRRAFALLPFAKVVLLLREPAAHLASSSSSSVMALEHGVSGWERTSALGGRDGMVTSCRRGQVKEHAVGPFQLAAALKVWARCQTPGGDGLDASCLGADFVEKLPNRTRRERREIDVCLAALEADAPPLSLGGRRCLGLPILSQRKLYKRMEDGAYVYRSIRAAVRVRVRCISGGTACN
ncbi:hypothetical protein EMIHUDRAFT_197928 [Emiliania huxleyi CCMP1516]|uniref:Uncharacterized protein n=2 Tax=Emiliania huxleyi TaxID=2903 RepID=A0A0D3IDZ2_EMIH1|nr:hypothetical protein EMIHUDRAFT_197928 [Emiliania huxleyi CCMP1516]EOD09477.1 hypothetical protein EMIHUDRAFT_197928 [Emiliania huxleyi CCMP1516]|eukprot:XP_005761906.1 hypothetical protein EMIHUDRAFT_197928 [Emiliania huxleyi CCMP1516]